MEKVEQLKREKELKITTETFPELGNKKQNTNKPEKTVNFLDKLKTKKKEAEKIVENIDLDYENLKPGWVLLKRDPKTGEKIEKIKPSIEPVKRENDFHEIDVLNALVKLHEKRKNEYIQLWGYDEWERMYICPNYDYNYFDRLDEEMEDYDSDEYDSDLTNDGDTY